MELGKQYSFASAFTLGVDKNDSRCESLWAIFEGIRDTTFTGKAFWTKLGALTTLTAHGAGQQFFGIGIGMTYFSVRINQTPHDLSFNTEK